MPIQIIDDVLLGQLENKAVKSSRLRVNHNFHKSMEDNLHRFLNVIARNSYIRPHRHLSIPKDEAFIVLKGELAYCIFDNNGNITQVAKLDGKYTIGVDISAGEWHSLVCLSETCVCYEVKPGPYQKATDKDFAPWAPQENTPEASAYLEELTEQVLSSL